MAEPWPSTLQGVVNQSSFQYAFGNTVLRSDTDVGPAKLRRRFTRPVDQIQFSFNLTKAQWDIFYEFFNTTLNGGVTPFLYTNPLNDEEEQWRVVTPPVVQPFGFETFTVAMSVERMPG